MPVILDGDATAAAWRTRIKARADESAFMRSGHRPCLVTVLVGDDEASRAYVSRKHQDCEALGFASRQIDLPASIPQADLLALIDILNRDDACHGLIVQLPLPAHLDAGAVIEAISPDKDVDGLHPLNLGRMLAGQPALRPCTPSAILALLREYDVPLAGRRVAIIGRGLLVGRPLAAMLTDTDVDAVVTVLHRGTADLAPVLRESDVIISAAGQPDLVRADMVRPGACVVGVGITYVDGQMVSDIADNVAQVAGWVTPRHGSVGPMTRAMLMRNLLDAALSLS
ncbi:MULTISPECIES: bifunctional 5,10-methylenetetrahydrofolate dehydrogenase/5,10-methenyltetrahydrofolate cyclohydrolase [Sphingobium]|uniref:bifunctional 5,10-methylenetetrahydrofolate dehydrogenase/5,10-methenyltetrahydrofolate cyclohydrolase n=1 Tax=Sphingobium TaxID=165695 RepID=UPI0015ECC2B9|nr:MULTISPECIES: bifunctional 5,10-methylenetetrahydrofolate dehydrogenase/5,10-methenyltetrahydrofolate cyclohydrolase [Sphingobium]MCW2362737.1 methylenetetrahydrofolate dehydrogenase (NADP+)/methenyltetrahydrofolate cyclohydrolase [Sphingobium sp. B10D3B]MCW2400583.1 methylenetetrahydrofolate dehydrogenase (NADP+)/methenyltetrahydrofolate cyclohydrolase [Sphingobium sp. B10D7B]MCW2407562.1 methylenetetrahydrofolate dehydrogenase (NADP+)/methenyltetrahydrofolate cyclohydrolase [Sphingobium xan